MFDFYALTQHCAPTVDRQTMAAVASTESAFNPFAIGVVGGRLERQPQNRDEAIATAEALAKDGRNFSVGVVQVNVHNLPTGQDRYADAFDACKNLALGATVLKDCYSRASVKFPDQQQALRAAFSCYYSGDFERGFRPDRPGEMSYVAKVVAQASVEAKPIPFVPAIAPQASDKTSQSAPAAAGSAPVTAVAATPAPPPPDNVSGIIDADDSGYTQTASVIDADGRGYSGVKPVTATPAPTGQGDTPNNANSAQAAATPSAEHGDGLDVLDAVPVTPGSTAPQSGQPSGSSAPTSARQPINAGNAAQSGQ